MIAMKNSLLTLFVVLGVSNSTFVVVKPVGRRVTPQDGLFLLVIAQEAVETRSEVISFDTSKLKNVETLEKNTLPDAATLKEETRPNVLPDVSAVAQFDVTGLRHVETQDKVTLPSAELNEQESVETRSEVLSFDTSKLKSVETVEKNTLPTAATIKEEDRPEVLPNLSAVAGFDVGSLKSVETEEKVVLPSADGENFWYSISFFHVLITCV